MRRYVETVTVHNNIDSHTNSRRGICWTIAIMYISLDINGSETYHHIIQ